MPRIRREVEQGDGWSRWVPPVMQGYRMACCDCGLVHDMEFAVVQVTGENGDGTWEHGAPLDPTKYRVLFRAKRNNRSTAAMRRTKKKKL